ncbi:MAG: glycosyltransferase family 1 protein, partial [Patescibacteria group bacterium]
AIDIRLIGKKRTGDEMVFFELTRALLKQDTENQYLLVTDTDDPTVLSVIYARLECIGQNNVEVVSLSGKNRFLWNLVSVPLFLLRRKVDVYHTQYILPFFVPHRTKVLTHVHDVSFRAYPELIGWKDRLFLSLLIPPSLRRADLILVPSQFTKDEIVRYYRIQPEKISVVSNAVSADFLESTRGAFDENALREKYHLPEKFFLSVGTQQPRKNLPFLIRSLALLQKRLPEAKFVIVGSRNAHHTDASIERVVAEEKLEESVIFSGYVDQKDLPALVSLAWVFVFPSLYEGFGIPLLEAMSQGVPVASSEAQALQEIGGEAALYFDPTNLASCEEKLYTLYTDSPQRERLISLGKERIKSFSWEKSAGVLRQLYENISSEKTSG